MLEWGYTCQGQGAGTHGVSGFRSAGEAAAAGAQDSICQTTPNVESRPSSPRLWRYRCLAHTIWVPATQTWVPATQTWVPATSTEIWVPGTTSQTFIPGVSAWALYIVNASDGTATRVHATNTFGGGTWQVLSSHNGTLYAINDTNDALYTVNVSSGTVTRVHATNIFGSGTWQALSSHNGTLYAINNSNNALYTVNTSNGTVSRVNSTYTFGTGAWNSLTSHNGTLYTVNDSNDALYTADASTGIATRVHNSNTFGTGVWKVLSSGISSLNFPIQGFRSLNSGRLTLWRTSSDTNSRLRFKIIDGESKDIIIENIIGIP